MNFKAEYGVRFSSHTLLKWSLLIWLCYLQVSLRILLTKHVNSWVWQTTTTWRSFGLLQLNYQVNMLHTSLLLGRQCGTCILAVSRHLFESYLLPSCWYYQCILCNPSEWGSFDFKCLQDYFRKYGNVLGSKLSEVRETNPLDQTSQQKAKQNAAQSMEFKIGYLGCKNQPCELLMITVMYWKIMTSVE